MIVRRALPRPGLSAPSQCLRRSLQQQQRTVTTVDPGHESDLTRGKILPEHPPAYNAGHRMRPIDSDRRIGANDQFEAFKRFRQESRHLGSRLSKHYQPHKQLTDPAAPKDVSLELLMAAGCHLGHATGLWNPGNQRWIFGVRDGIHIIGLEHTASLLRRAARVVEGVAANGGIILFVGTRPGFDRAVVRAAQQAGGFHLFTRWRAGGITNGKQILGHGKVVRENEVGETDPNFTEEEKMELPPVRPDLVVCLNPLENYTLLHECGLWGIPTIGVIDTDADPTWVTYSIPANDDSLRSIQLIAGVLGRAGAAGQAKRAREIQLKKRAQEDEANARLEQQREMVAEQAREEAEAMDPDTFSLKLGDDRDPLGGKWRG